VTNERGIGIGRKGGDGRRTLEENSGMASESYSYHEGKRESRTRTQLSGERDSPPLRRTSVFGIQNEEGLEKKKHLPDGPELYRPEKKKKKETNSPGCAEGEVGGRGGIRSVTVRNELGEGSRSKGP